MANRTGQGSEIPTLQRRMGVSQDIERVAFQSSNPVSPMAGSSAEAAAGVLASISDRVNDRLDIAARVEGAKQGALAGMTGLPEHMDDTTIRGAAFNKSADDAAATQYDLMARQQLLDLEEKFQTDPAGFKNNSDSWLNGIMPKLESYDPILAGQFKATYQLQSTEALNRVKGQQEAILRDQAQEGALNRITAAHEDLIRSAPALFGDDPKAALDAFSNISVNAAKVGDAAHQIGPDGRPLFTAAQRVDFSKSTNTIMAQQLAAAWVSKQPDPAAALAAWENGTAAINMEDGKGAKKQLLIKDYLAPSDYLEATDAVRTDVSRRQTQLRAQQTVVTKGLDQADDLIKQGFNPGKENLDGLVLAADNSGDPTLAARARQVQALSTFQDGARQWRPDELQSWINSERSRLNTAKAVTPPEAERVDIAEKLLASMNTEIGRDPLSWANRVGVVSTQPLNPADPVSMQKRAQDANTVSTHYGTPVQLMTDEESAQWKSNWDIAPPDQKVGMMAALQSGFGRDSIYAFGDLSKVSPAVANMGGLLTQGQQFQNAARDFAIGDTALTAGVKILPKAGQLQDTHASTIGDAFGYSPNTEQAVIDTADRIYAARALRKGKTPDDFDEALYGQALQEAAGAWWDKNGNQYGGIATQRSGHNVILPPDMTEDNFNATVKNLTDDDLFQGSVGGGMPQYSNGKNASGADFKHYWLISSGPGKYVVSTTNPKSGQPVFLRGTNPDGIYELDVQKLQNGRDRARAVDPHGFPIDLKRPIIHNADGSFSTEKTITEEFDGKYYTIPTIVEGKQLSKPDAIKAFISGKNPAVQTFDDPVEAEKAAKERSEYIGRIRGAQ